MNSRCSNGRIRRIGSKDGICGDGGTRERRKGDIGYVKCIRSNSRGGQRGHNRNRGYNIYRVDGGSCERRGYDHGADQHGTDDVGGQNEHGGVDTGSSNARDVDIIGGRKLTVRASNQHVIARNGIIILPKKIGVVRIAIAIGSNNERPAIECQDA